MQFIQSRIESFQNAIRGLRDILTTEHNAWVHSIFTVGVLLAAFLLKIDFFEFLLIIIVISLVWITEAFNTVLELVIDIVAPEYNEAARRAKDIAAAAVLFSSITALITGLVIFGPLLLVKMLG